MNVPSNSADALAAEWDERYTALMPTLPATEPNAVLIAEVSALPPGRALDIGCSVGAEAIWLAARGWQVRALDVSQVALDRAAARAHEAGVTVQWAQGRLEDESLPADGFDLVTAFYPALRRSPGRDAERALVAAVAPGGTLLVVHHADLDVEAAKAHGFDPADYLLHDDVVALLGENWEVRIAKRQPRSTPTVSHHTHDDVVLARRPSAHLR